MIEKYKLNNNCLYIYLNYNYEFGNINNNDLPFFKNIKNLIKNINFKGNKIVLVVGSIVIGTIFINNNFKQNQFNSINNDNNIEYVHKVILNDFNDFNEFVIDNKEEISSNYLEKISNNNENTLNNDIKTNNDTKINNYNNMKSNTINHYNDVNDNIDNNINTNNIINNDVNNNSNINTNDIINDDVNENTINNGNIITVYRSNGNILDLELEEYLIGVVAGEMPASFEVEALKTQAIIARTYALKTINSGKKITDKSSTQIYIDKMEMYSKWNDEFNKYYNKIKKAVDDTEGIIITYNNELIDAVYFSNSNGYTEDANEVWGYDIPYLKSIESPWDINTTRYKKEILITYEEASDILGYKIDNSLDIYNVLRNGSNRITSICLNEKVYTGLQIRNLFKLNSTDFVIEKKDNGLLFITYGYGHGVGMSQYGAQGMAKNGHNYEEIIKYYYKNVDIEKK